MPTKERHTLAKSKEDADRYFDMFCGYARAELNTIGPDQHLELAARYSKEVEYPAWFIGCYMGPYDVPSGLAFYNAFPSPVYASTHQDLVEDWLRTAWSDLRIRKERRPCRAPHKMAEYLVSYADWSIDVLNSNMDFETLWKSLDRIRFVGRYAGMRIVEGLDRAGIVFDGWIRDIRAGEGGWSPRFILSCFLPMYDELLNGVASKKTTAAVEALAATMWNRTQERIGDHSMYNFESLVCNFKQGLEARRYPGHALDNDLESIMNISDNPRFQINSLRLFELRKQIHPWTTLGEVQGWNGYREELSHMYRAHGFWWDDTIFDYMSSTPDMIKVRDNA